MDSSFIQLSENVYFYGSVSYYYAVVRQSPGANFAGDHVGLNGLNATFVI